MSFGILALASVGTGLAKGISGYYAGQAQGDMADAEGIMLEGEAMREADRIAEDGKMFAANQKMAYIGSGVQIGGSATVTLAQTDKWATAQADAVRNRGRAIRAYYGRSGKIARNRGVASFITNVAGGLAKGYGMYSATRGVKENTFGEDK